MAALEQGLGQVGELADGADAQWVDDLAEVGQAPGVALVVREVLEEVLGADKYAEILYKAGYKSAWHWCEKEAECHGLEGVAVFEHYMKRLSQRGWGLFEIQDIDLDKGTCSVKLKHSAFVYVYGKCSRKVDYMFTGWFAGAMDQILAARGSSIRTVAEQVYGGSEEGHEDGLFVTKPL